MEHPDFDKYDTSSMKNLGGGGAPTPQSQVEKVSQKFAGGAKASNGYGLTETNGGICGISGAEYSKRLVEKCTKIGVFPRSPRPRC